MSTPYHTLAPRAAIVLALHRASECCQIAHGLLLSAGDTAATQAAHEAGEAIAKCLGLTVTHYKTGDAMQP